MSRTIRRSGLLIALAATASLALSACATTPEKPAAESDTPETGIVIEHAYGSYKIDHAPTKIVTLGLLESDVAVELGVQPEAMAKFPFSPDGVSPWIAPALKGSPEVIDTAKAGTSGAELDVEAIALLAPEAIIAPTYAELGKYYDQLSKIAPVLGPSDVNYLQLDWQDQASSVAKALGKEEQGRTLIADAEKRVSDAAAKHSELAGHSYTLSLGTPDQLKVMNDPADASAVIMGAFGLSFSKSATELPGLNDGSSSAGVSEENVQAIDADVVLIGFFGADTQAFWEGSSLFKEVPAVKDGRYIAVNLAASTALRNPSPLSLDYVITELIEGSIVPVFAK